MGLCVLCSRPAYKGWRCKKHYEQHKITMRLRYIPKVRGRYKVGGPAGAEQGKKASSKASSRTAAKKVAARKTATKKSASKAATRKTTSRKTTARRSTARRSARA
jgi:hypothetical protein